VRAWILTAALLSACASRDANEFIAGAWAVRGKVTYRDAKTPDGRVLLAGHPLRRGAVLELDDAKVAVEGFNGFITLVEGSRSRKVGSLARIDGPMPAERVIKVLTGSVLDTKHVPPSPVAFRYELPYEGKPNADPASVENSKNMAYFFGPKFAPEAPPDSPVPDSLKQAGPVQYVHGIRVDPPKPTPEAARALVSSKGPVVVELNEMASAFAEDMKLPLTLDRIRRVAVLEDGSAELRIDGQAVRLSEGDDLIVAQ
jgi:hypothetical protein